MYKKTIQIVPSIVLYICAGLMAAYAIWSYIFCADVISQARAAGQLAASGSEYDIASFYMGNCGQYFVFALLLTAAGLLLQRKQQVKASPETVVSPAENIEINDELDEWFND